MAEAEKRKDLVSIGELLKSLNGEFPDLTISKIRFLETEGLLQPERTPSGYRKYSRSDEQRLRFILRLQKERYLPLKVIKEKLKEIESGRIKASDLSAGYLDDAPLLREDEMTDETVVLKADLEEALKVASFAGIGVPADLLPPGVGRRVLREEGRQDHPAGQ